MPCTSSRFAYWCCYQIVHSSAFSSQRVLLWHTRIDLLLAARVTAWCYDQAQNVSPPLFFLTGSSCACRLCRQQLACASAGAPVHRLHASRICLSHCTAKRSCSCHVHFVDDVCLLMNFQTSHVGMQSKVWYARPFCLQSATKKGSEGIESSSSCMHVQLCS